MFFLLLKYGVGALSFRRHKMQHADLRAVEDPREGAVAGKAAGDQQPRPPEGESAPVIPGEKALPRGIDAADEGQADQAAVGMAAEKQVDIPVLVCFFKNDRRVYRCRL